MAATVFAGSSFKFYKRWSGLGAIGFSNLLWHKHISLSSLKT